MTSLHLRQATATDVATLTTLAALDETAPLRQPALMAFEDGRPVAAMSLADGRVAADPFVHTAEAVALLRARRERRSAAPRRGVRRARFVLA